MIPQTKKDILNKFYELYGIDLLTAEQGSAAWMSSKLGVISASNASAVLAKTDSATRATYMSELVAEVATGIFPEINAKAMQWGKDNEDAARASYEFFTGREMVPVSFLFMDSSFRVGFSPDGIVGHNRGAEIKCPFNSKNYIEFLCMDKVKPEWEKQVQFSLWASGFEVWDFVQFDPRMKKKPLHMIEINKDEKLHKTLSDAVPQFISDMDKMLNKIGIQFGEQWLRLKDEGVKYA